MKAQMTVEFIIAAVIFFSMLLYIVVFLNASISEYREDFNTNDLQSRAVQISDLLVHNMEVGISGGHPVISYSRIVSLNDSCTDFYPGLLKTFDLLRNRIKIQINESVTKEIIMDCGPDMLGKVTKAGMSRFGVLDTTSQTLIINLWIW